MPQQHISKKAASPIITAYQQPARNFPLIHILSHVFKNGV